MDQLRASLEEIRERFMKLEHRVQHQVRRRMRETNRYVHENPWQTIGAAVAVAFVLGLYREAWIRVQRIAVSGANFLGEPAPVEFLLACGAVVYTAIQQTFWTAVR